MKNYLFLYGTLLPDRAPGSVRQVINALSPVSEGSMPGRIFDLGEYPGALFDESAQTRVWGRVFELPNEDSLLRQLDAYEEYFPERYSGSLFVREKRPITLANGSELVCWVYLYNRDPGAARPVPGGNYDSWIADPQSSHSP